MSNLDRRLTELTPAQRKLLEKRLQAKAQGKQHVTISHHVGDGPALLSFSQRRQWFLQQLEPDNPAYHRYSVNRLHGLLDVDALRRALDALIARHAILRTTYRMDADEPVQTVHPPTTSPLPVVDLTGLDLAEKQSRLEAHIHEQVHQPFDLGQFPPWRHIVFRLDKNEYTLLRISHHIASDRWSVGVLNRELAHFYASFSSGNRPNLPELPIQYVDFAVWQRQQIDHAADNSQLAYWLKKLGDAPSLLALPTDFPRPAEPALTGAIHRVVLSAEKTRAIKAFSQTHRVTPFMTLLTLYYVLLHRYTGATDLLVGVPVAGRPVAETQALIGLFINTIVLRADLSGNPAFADFLRQIRQTSLDGFANQSLPFEKLIEALKPERIPGHPPLFQVMFDYLNTPMQPLMLAGLDVEQLSMREQAASHDISLVVHDESEKMTLTIEYDSDLYRPKTVEHMLDHLLTLLDGVLDDANRPIGSLPLLTDAEQKQLVCWSGSSAPIADCDGVHHLFEAQVNRTPNNVAVVAGDHSLTYAELDRRANQLAVSLQQQGIGSDDIVALEIARSAEWIIAILGVLKSGAAYLPLDPETPTARRQFQIEDSGAKLCLKRSAISAQFSAFHPDPSAFFPHPPPRSPAYVIYTSGSTGRPKGVIVPHKAVVNFVTDAIKRYSFSADDRVLQFASPAFDTAVEEIFPTLASGGTLILRPNTLPDTFADFARQVERDAITILDLPTAFWHSWVAEMARDNHSFPNSVRLVIVGGEAARLDAYEQWRALVGPNSRWVNTYGPTETTVVATAYEPDSAVSLHTMPIGRPIDNVFAYVLDPYRNPAPIGIPGNLHIGGAGVALGYLNRPKQTADRFIQSALSTIPISSPLYNTGDRVRWLPDGNLEFIGRNDDQIKIRGVRVETGEVEAALREHPDVAEAIVLSHELDHGGLQLIAFVVPHVNVTIMSNRIRTHLAAMLPTAMLPGQIIVLDKLPLTTTGKIDRRRLLDFDSAENDPIQDVASSSAEIVMTGLWAELLNLSSVTLHDNFFDLGGHSLLAVQLISRITATLRHPLPLRALFDTPTPAGLLDALASTAADRQQLERTAAIVMQVAQLSDTEARAHLQNREGDR